MAPDSARLNQIKRMIDNSGIQGGAKAVSKEDLKTQYTRSNLAY